MSPSTAGPTRTDIFPGRCHHRERPQSSATCVEGRGGQVTPGAQALPTALGPPPLGRVPGREGVRQASLQPDSLLCPNSPPLVKPQKALPSVPHPGRMLPWGRAMGPLGQPVPALGLCGTYYVDWHLILMTAATRPTVPGWPQCPPSTPSILEAQAQHGHQPLHKIRMRKLRHQARHQAPSRS